MIGWALIAVIAVVAGIIGYAIDKKRGQRVPSKQNVLIAVGLGVVLVGVALAIAFSG